MRSFPLTQLSVKENGPWGVVLDGEHDEIICVDVLEADVIRVQVRPDGVYRLGRTWMVVDGDGAMPREGRPREDMSRFQRPPVEVVANDDGIRLVTDVLGVEVNPTLGCLNWYTADGKLFAADMPRRGYTYDLAGQSIAHYMRLRDDACFYGFGERAGPLNKRGMRMEMRNLDAYGYNARTTDPLYKHFPIYITYLPELGIAYGLVYDNLATTMFDMGCEIDAIWGPYVKMAADDGDIDYYMLFGPSVEDVVEKIAWLTGKPFLPPRYTLGYLGSTMSYTDALDAAQQLRKFSELVREHEIPCDGFHLSSGYTTDSNGVRNVFTWNNDRIPDPSAMAAGFHASSIRLMANVKPYLIDVNPHHNPSVEQRRLIMGRDGECQYVTRFWSGGAYESANGAYIDFTSAAGYDWWQGQLKEQLFAYGIDAPWNDNNEFEIWDDEAQCHGFGEVFPIGLGRPLQTLLMGHASYYATAEDRPQQRPFVLSRSGCPGIQRYAQTWSGDNSTSWESLKYNIPMGLGLSLSGAPNTGHDIGGFHGPRPSPELFVRWVQNGVFHPRFTIHSWNSDGTVNEPWMYPEVLPYIREAIQFRYRLMPYLYSLFVESHRSGHPIIRPTVYQYAADEQTHNQSFEFLLGANLLVASVVEEGALTRDVYLPAGNAWYDFYSGNVCEGGQMVTVAAPLSRCPLFVPEGGIIPMGKVMRYVGETLDDERVVYLFPHVDAGVGSFTLHEDDGETTAYLAGEVAILTLTLTSSADSLTLLIDIGDDGYTLPYQFIDFVLPTGENRSLQVRGYEAQEKGTVDQRRVHVRL